MSILDQLYTRRDSAPVDFNYYSRPLPLERDTNFPLAAMVNSTWNSLQPSTRPTESGNNPSGGYGNSTADRPLGSTMSMADAVAYSQRQHPHDYFDLPAQYFNLRDMGIGALIGQLPMGNSTAAVMGPILSTIYNQKAGDREAITRNFISTMPFVGAFQKYGEWLGGTPWARMHPAESLYNGDVEGSKIADEAFRAGASPAVMQNIHDYIASQKELGGAGNTRQGVADARESIRQIAEAIALGQADPYYTQGNMGGTGANTVNAANATGVPTYNELPMDIYNTIMMAERMGQGYDNATLANYGLTRAENGAIVSTGQPSPENQDTLTQIDQGLQSAGFTQDFVDSYNASYDQMASDYDSALASFNDSAPSDSGGGGWFDSWFSKGGKVKFVDGGQVALAENVLSRTASRGYSPEMIAKALMQQQDTRRVYGPGNGMDDAVPASIEGYKPAALSNDEHVISADIVSALGDGSSEAGHKVLENLAKLVRMQKFGSSQQPPKLKMGLESLLRKARDS